MQALGRLTGIPTLVENSSNLPESALLHSIEANRPNGIAIRCFRDLLFDRNIVGIYCRPTPEMFSPHALFTSREANWANSTAHKAFDESAWEALR